MPTPYVLLNSEFKFVLRGEFPDPVGKPPPGCSWMPFPQSGVEHGGIFYRFIGMSTDARKSVKFHAPGDGNIPVYMAEPAG